MRDIGTTLSALSPGVKLDIKLNRFPAIFSAKLVGSPDLLTDRDIEVAASRVAFMVLAGRAATWAATASIGSMANPSTAVTSPVVDGVAEVNAAGVFIPDAGVENVDRNRNIAEGFSLDNLKFTVKMDYRVQIICTHSKNLGALLGPKEMYCAAIANWERNCG